MEMLLVMMIMSLMVGISYPSLSAGLDSLRMRGATEDTAAIFNAAMTRAERRQQAVEITVSPLENLISITSVEPGFLRLYQPPAGIAIVQVLPSLPVDVRLPRRFLLMPGGAPPRIGIVLAGPRGLRRLVAIDPVTGVPGIRPVDTREILR
jgi:type II secretory pathway pseudopilin PulG